MTSTRPPWPRRSNSLGFGGRKIATAVNGRFVAAAARPATKLTDGDRIEVVAPMQGG